MPARWEQCGRGQDGGTPEQAAEQGHGRTEPPIDSVRSFAAKPRPSLLELSVRPSAHACFEVAGSLRGVQGRSEFSEEPKPRQEVRVSSQPAPPPPPQAPLPPNLALPKKGPQISRCTHSPRLLHLLHKRSGENAPLSRGPANGQEAHSVPPPPRKGRKGHWFGAAGRSSVFALPLVSGMPGRHSAARLCETGSLGTASGPRSHHVRGRQAPEAPASGPSLPPWGWHQWDSLVSDMKSRRVPLVNVFPVPKKNSNRLKTQRVSTE